MPSSVSRRRPASLAPLVALACAAAVSCAHSPAAGISAAVQAVAPGDSSVPPAEGERHLRRIRQLTFSGNNAEAYFSASGKQLVFQRQDSVSTGCDQEYIVDADGSGLHRVSNGEG